MYNAKKPTPEELPSSRQLLRSTVIAAVAAAGLLVTVVLPAEYGVDPTGIGRMLGLTGMGEIKQQLAEEAEADRRLAAEPTRQEDAAKSAPAQSVTEVRAIAEAQDAAPEPAPKETGSLVQPTASATPETPEAAAAADTRNDEISITLSPGQGTEVKLVMMEGAKAQFEWTASGGRLNYDTHGDGGGRSISYDKGRGVAGDKGVLEAAFDGNHGWFWRNRTDQDVTMTLRTSGAYRELKRVL